MNSNVCYALQMIGTAPITETEKHELIIQIELIKERINRNEAIQADYDNLLEIIGYIFPIYESKYGNKHPHDVEMEIFVERVQHREDTMIADQLRLFA